MRKLRRRIGESGLLRLILPKVVKSQRFLFMGLRTQEPAACCMESAPPKSGSCVHNANNKFRYQTNSSSSCPPHFHWHGLFSNNMINCVISGLWWLLVWLRYVSTCCNLDEHFFCRVGLNSLLVTYFCNDDTWWQHHFYGIHNHAFRSQSFQCHILEKQHQALVIHYLCSLHEY